MAGSTGKLHRPELDADVKAKIEAFIEKRTKELIK